MHTERNFLKTLSITLICCISGGGCTKKMEDYQSADLVLLNGKIVTMDDQGTIAEAAACKLGKILAVGGNDEVRRSIGRLTRVIDLKGRTAVPGLIDSHCHITGTALEMEGVVDLSEEAGVGSLADIRQKIAGKAGTLPAGEWIRGAREDDYKLAEKRHPTRWDLDQAAAGHPVIISTVGGHFSVANSKALELAGITRDTPDPVGGMIDHDPATGEPTGGLHEEAEELVRRVMPPEKPLTREETARVVRDMLRKVAAAGLTCIYDNAGSTEVTAVLDLRERGELPVRFRVDLGIDHFRQMSGLGLTDKPFGDEWVKLCGMKFFFDGSISARTAFVSEPYLNRDNFYGVMATTRELAARTLEEAYAAGCRISAHANGDRAIAMYLEIMEELQRKYPRHDPRNRIIHCTVLNPELVDRIKRLGMLPTLFGAYPYYHGDKLIPAFGEKRLEWMFAARSLLDAGVAVSANSDYDASPFPPLMGIHALVNRRTKAGKPVGEQQKISVVEALRLYTINAAYQSFDEDLLGSVEPGKCADLVVLGEDILTVPAERIIDIPVEMTLVGGKVVFEK